MSQTKACIPKRIAPPQTSSRARAPNGKRLRQHRQSKGSSGYSLGRQVRTKCPRRYNSELCLVESAITASSGSRIEKNTTVGRPTRVSLGRMMQAYNAAHSRQGIERHNCHNIGLTSANCRNIDIVLTCPCTYITYAMLGDLVRLGCVRVSVS